MDIHTKAEISHGELKSIKVVEYDADIGDLYGDDPCEGWVVVDEEV